MEYDKDWQAQWIWSTGVPRTTTGQHEIVYFRRTFTVPADGNYQLTIDVSADSRYRLYLNGESIAVGPCKGDDKTHYYETLDLSERLRPGQNILAARVLHYAPAAPYRMGSDGPIAIWRTTSGAFLFDGALIASDDSIIETLHTDQRWRCLQDRSWHYTTGSMAFFADASEQVDGTLLPHGWEQNGYDDSDWQAAVPFCAVDDRNWGQLAPWQLAPRPIPLLFEREQGFTGLTRLESQDQQSVQPFWISQDPQPLHLAPGTHLALELDAGELTTGYPRLELTGGNGSSIRLLCAECYEPQPEQKGQRHKGVRDQVEGNVLLGDYDEYKVAGYGQDERYEVYEPFWFRTFRYLRLEVTTGEEALTIQRFSYRETGYPLDVSAEFACSDDTLNPMWEISLRTLQRCMHETYEDCPYYEQLQYTMDTRLQMLFTYNISGDDRLARKAIYDFHSSLLPNGMLQSRYPSVYQQVIPGFALFWVFMLHDHYRYFGDAALIKRYRPTLDAVLDWFERQLTPEGIVGAAPEHYWSYVDWVPAWKATSGTPTAGQQGPITVYSLMYASALEIAAELNAWTRRAGMAHEYRERALHVKTAVMQHCWSEEQGMFRDGPQAPLYSQHAQIWAVLSETVTGPDARALMERTLERAEELAQVTYVMSFFLFRALAAVDLYDKSFALWDRWRHFLDLHVTTWPESDQEPRSECHAWSATPLSEFPTEILGVKPGAPGYTRIAVAPQIGHLTWARGKVATPRGQVAVDWHIDEEGKFQISVTGPRGVPIDLLLPNNTLSVFPNGGLCEAGCQLSA